MRRERLPLKDRLLMLEQINEIKRLRSRKKRLYNRLFRKSFIFIFSWITRVSYILLFLIVALLYEKSDGFTEEIVEEATFESYETYSRYRKKTKNTLTIVTKESIYTSSQRLPHLFAPGDTVLIERNIFGKPIYFTKPNFSIKYSFGFPVAFYFIIAFLSLISLWFNDGMDRFSLPLMITVSCLNLVAILYFFLF